MSRIFFISDLHFDHENILKYDNLPYDTVEQMNQDLIHKWNSIVSNKDTVWFLGDLHLGGKQSYERIASLVNKLHGNKHMIRGNHDRLKDIDYLKMGFKSVHSRPIILKEHFVLSHAPFSNMNENSGLFYIFGHIHQASEVPQCKNSKCVTSTLLNGYPITIEEFDNYEVSRYDQR